MGNGPAVDPVAPPASRFRVRLPQDPRVLVAFQLSVNTLVGQVFLGFFQDWRVAATAVGTALIAEVGLSWLTQRRIPSLLSAYITGISIGILLDSPWLWIYALGSLLSIASKYLIHLRGRHIFNPSNFGVVAMLVLAPHVVAISGSQWTNMIWIMLAIAALGSMIMARIGRLDVILAFVGAFAVFGLLRAWLTDVPVAFALGPLLGAALQLFTFFMLTDPRTSPPSRRGRIAYGITVAAVDAILRVLRIIYSPFYALWLVCFLWTLASVVFARRLVPQPVSPTAAPSRSGE